MNILRLSAKHFKETEYYYKIYIGDEDVSAFDGIIEIEGGLGWVRFTSLYASRHIIAKAGTGIEAGWGIKAGEGIEAGLSIVCKATIKFKYRLFAGTATFRNKLNEDAKIVCGRLDGGVVCYGNVTETLKESKDD